MSDRPDAAETELAPQRVAELRDAGAAELVDVRANYEWDAGHLAGARHIEMNELTANAESIPKDRAVIFYCRSGNRSSMAAQAFREAGWDAHNMAGGITAWVDCGLAIEPEDGEVAQGRPPSA
jgi:rhodanese-related sulfurtransferase